MEVGSLGKVGLGGHSCGHGGPGLGWAAWALPEPVVSSLGRAWWRPALAQQEGPDRWPERSSLCPVLYV